MNHRIDGCRRRMALAEVVGATALYGQRRSRTTVTRVVALIVLLLGCLAAFWVSAPVAKAAGAPFAVTDVAVSDKPVGDFPFVPALDGYKLVSTATSTWQKDAEYARYVFMPAEAQTVEVAGRMTMKHFATTSLGQSSAKVLDSYQQLFAGLGGTKLFEGMFTGGRIDSQPRSEQQSREGATYLLRTPEREIWAQVSIREDGAEYVLVVVEKGPLVLKTAPLKVADLKRSLDETGKAILYVNFEYDRADLRPDAKPVLDEVAALLKADAALKLSIEGHTDNAGAAAYNQGLSERRAAAVLAALVARGVANTGGRLVSAGRGASTPIADNKTDEGRARNRRVELIKR